MRILVTGAGPACWVAQSCALRAREATKAKHELPWAPSVEFAEGLAETIAWYRDHQAWLGRIESGAYRE